MAEVEVAKKAAKYTGNLAAPITWDLLSEGEASVLCVAEMGFVEANGDALPSHLFHIRTNSCHWGSSPASTGEKTPSCRRSSDGLSAL